MYMILYRYLEPKQLPGTLLCTYPKIYNVFYKDIYMMNNLNFLNTLLINYYCSYEG